MTPQKFVVRLLDADATLMAWATVYASPRPQDRAGSCPFWPLVTPTPFTFLASGTVTEMSVHWCELDVARQAPVAEPLTVEAGQTGAFHWIEPVWIVQGVRGVALPPVTVGEPVVLAPPAGELMSIGG